MRRLAALLAMLWLAACDELGNPVPGVGQATTELVRETETRRGIFVTEVRFVPPGEASALIRSLADEVDHVDPRVPPGQALVVVMVRYRPRAGMPVGQFVHMQTTFRYANDTEDSRVWVGRTARARMVGFFAVRGVPVDVRTEGS